ncbi:MAG: hypothetical protein ACTSO7_16490 [Candidatus Heimdallarchaeota archaeon]
MRKKYLKLLLIILFLNFSFLTTFSYNSLDVKAWGSTAIPICLAPEDQGHAKMALTSDGDIVIVWADPRNGDADIYAQRLDPFGNPLWALNGVPVCTAPEGQMYCVPISDESGGVYIIWEDGRSNVDWDIYAQRLDSSGNPLWDLNGIPICNFSEDQQRFDVCIDSGNTRDIIVSWTDERDGGSSSSDIYAQKVALNGSTLWADNGVVVCNETGRQSKAKIVSDYNQGAFICWEDRRSGATSDYSNIYMQRLDENGSNRWAATGKTICLAADEQTDLYMINGYPESAIIAWTDNRSGNYDIYAQQVSKYGILELAVNGEAMCNAAGIQTNVKMCSDGNYGAIITWDDERNNIGSGYYDIFAQSLNATGYLQWTTNGKIISNSEEEQYVGKIISDADSGAIITWVQKNSPTEMLLYAQRVQSDGTCIWGNNGTAINPVPDEEQYDTDVVLIKEGEAVFSWIESFTLGATDLYAQYYRDLTIPYSNSPEDATYQQGSTETISWILNDNTGGGYYKVKYGIPESIHSTEIIPWTEWDNQDVVEAPINTSVVGLFFYRIELNDTFGNVGFSDVVLINITEGSTTPSPGGFNPTPYIIAASIVAGVGITVAIVIVVIKKKRAA